MIQENLLLDFGAKKIAYNKSDQLLREGETPSNYYQVVIGEVKMNNFNLDGKNSYREFSMPDKVIENWSLFQ